MSWLGSWAQPRDLEARHASRPLLDLGLQPWGQAVPGSTWHRGFSLSPAVGGNRVRSPRLPGYRWEGTASPHPGSPDFTNSASQPWLPCPECEAEAHLGHTLTHVLCRWPTSLLQPEKPSPLLLGSFTQAVLSLACKKPLCSCQAQLRSISIQEGDKGTQGGNNTPGHSRPYAGLTCPTASRGSEYGGTPWSLQG